MNLGADNPQCQDGGAAVDVHSQGAVGASVGVPFACD
jgi:hypothetical protein